MSSNPKKGINLESLWFYFDSIERDCMDLGMLDQKSSKVQALKGKLMRLPKAEFEAAIKTMETLVEGKSDAEAHKKSGEQQRKRASLELFERTASAGDVKASVDAVTRVT
jgi:hypothetical protein